MTIAGKIFTVSQAATTTVDTTAPLVSLTSPSSGSSVSATVTVTANASDNVGVSKVEIYRDGTLLLADTASPYSVSDDTTKLSNGSHTYMAKAYDAAGNSSSSSSTVTVSNGTTGTTGQLQGLQTNLPPYLAEARGVAVDHSGNTIAVGNFYGNVDFGSGLISGAGGYDVFVVKYTPQGVRLWVKRLGSAGADQAYGVAVDSQNNIIVVGTFQGSVDFGGGVIAANGGATGQDAFVAKYSPSGAYIWAKSFGSTANDFANGVAVDGSDNVLVTSQSGGIVNFGNGISLTGHGGYDVALVKFQGVTAGSITAGTTLWAQLYGGSGQDNATGLAVDRNGDVLVTGNFGGSGNLGGTPLPGSQSGGIFVAKYSGVNGTYKWSRMMGNNSGYGIVTDPGTGNVFVTGGFTGSVDLGGGAMTTPWGGTGGLFVAAYDASGTYQWAKVYGGNGDTGYAIAVDGSGNLALAGSARGTIDFTSSGVPMSGTGFLLANFTTSGTFRWAKRSNQSQSWGYGVGFDSLGHVVAGGSFYNTADFGGISGAASGGAYNVFVGQYMK